jgi:hypothetical protein
VFMGGVCCVLDLEKRHCARELNEYPFYTSTLGGGPHCTY